MTKKILQKTLALLNVFIILVFIILGCAQVSSNFPKQTNQNNEHYWFVDSNGHFHTNDVKMAQKEIPFTIIVPDYIPDIFGSNYSYEITGPFENPLSNYIEVKIQYIDEQHQIYISEYNKKVIMLPNDEAKPVYHDIIGIKVLQQQSFLYGSEDTIEGLSFNWNIDALTFEVEIFNIPEEEGIKIVESMIN